VKAVITVAQHAHARAHRHTHHPLAIVTGPGADPEGPVVDSEVTDRDGRRHGRMAYPGWAVATGQQGAGPGSLRTQAGSTFEAHSEVASSSVT
jgi:hypothetical protein